MATIKDIAERAGVSVSTVSHVVNGTRFVSPEKVEKVKTAIAELEQTDQLPNFIVKKNWISEKRSAAPAKTAEKKYILILLSERYSLFQDQVRKKLEQLLQDKGYAAISACYDNDAERLSQIRALFTGTEDPAGMIAFPDHTGIMGKEFFEALRLPVVLIGKSVEGFETDALFPDTFEGGYAAVKHLIKSGHERIAFLSEAEELSAHRFGGYKKALEEFGMPYDPEVVFSGLQTEEAVYETMLKIMEDNVRATALIVADSFPLIPVFKFLNARHILVPRDISVVSLNEFEWAPLLNPELTCIDKHPGLFAEKAVEILEKRIENGEAAGDPVVSGGYSNLKYSSHLNVRSSTCGIGRGPFGERAESADLLVLSENEKEKIRENHYTAAISFHYLGKAWMQLQEKGIRKIFEELGISIIAVTDAHFDPELQCRQLESIKYLKPDILISIPTDAGKTAGSFREIVESRIQLVLIGNVPDGFSPGDYVSCISVNEHSHGTAMGRGLGEYMQKHGLKNAGIIRHGVKDFYATRQRDTAAEQALCEEYPDVHICGYVDFVSEDDVYRKTIDFLKYHPETEAVYISWDGPALRAIEAINELARTDIAVVTGDLDYAVAFNMAKGGAVKMLSAQCPYEQGVAIALAAANALLERKVPSFIGVEPVSVTPDNLLKRWRTVFKDEPPADLKNALRLNPNYVI